RSLAGKVVVIDPGHQSKADLSREPIGPGAAETKEKTAGGSSGVKSRTPEYKITLAISKLLKAKLEANGIKVIMT
ncbi:N-acetylmuramoyl-L-alanine amidase, partial [Candidatus Aquicultor secundus]